MSITMKRGLNVCILLLSTTFIMAQESYQVGEVSEVNLGDGRHFFRERKNEKPLNGEFRIIDGYRSEYVQAVFKDGLYDGVYKEYKRNELRTEGAYKEGRKHGTFHRYVNGAVTEEYTFRNDTLDGDVIAYFENGKIKRKGFYKNGREQGNFKEYNWEDGHLWSDENYEDGRLHGRQWKLMNGRHLYTTTSYYNHGKPVGKYEKLFADTEAPEVLGQYDDNGHKTGLWLEFNDLGDTVTIEHYANDLLDGERVKFASTGVREEVERYKEGKRDGLWVVYAPSGNKVIRETHYKNDKKNGTERVWITSNQNDYIETFTYVNGRRHGAYEAVYVPDKAGKIKEGTLKTKGEYRNDNRFGHWISYDTRGNIDREWEE